MTAQDASRYAANRQAGVEGAALYRALAELESSPELAEVYNHLADSEERHVELWPSGW